MGLDELRSIVSPETLETARTQGIKISIDGFRKRNRIGHTSMRHTNSDLFEELKTNIARIENLTAYGSLTGKRSHYRSANAKRIALERRVEELEMLLDQRDRDVLRLMVLLEQTRKS